MVRIACRQEHHHCHQLYLQLILYRLSPLSMHPIPYVSYSPRCSSLPASLHALIGAALADVVQRASKNDITKEEQQQVRHLSPAIITITIIITQSHTYLRSRILTLITLSRIVSSSHTYHRLLNCTISSQLIEHAKRLTAKVFNKQNSLLQLMKKAKTEYLKNNKA